MLDIALTSGQIGWGIGAIAGGVWCIIWCVKTVRVLISQAKTFIIETVGPKQDISAEVKRALSNGGGDIIRSIVKSENEMQSRSNHAEMTQIVSSAIKEHEFVEQQRLSMQLQEFRQEITERWKLFPKRRKSDRRS